MDVIAITFSEIFCFLLACWIWLNIEFKTHSLEVLKTWFHSKWVMEHLGWIAGRAWSITCADVARKYIAFIHMSLLVLTIIAVFDHSALWVLFRDWNWQGLIFCSFGKVFDSLFFMIFFGASLLLYMGTCIVSILYVAICIICHLFNRNCL